MGLLCVREGGQARGGGGAFWRMSTRRHKYTLLCISLFLFPTASIHLSLPRSPPTERAARVICPLAALGHALIILSGGLSSFCPTFRTPCVIIPYPPCVWGPSSFCPSCVACPSPPPLPLSTINTNWWYRFIYSSTDPAALEPQHGLLPRRRRAPVVRRPTHKVVCFSVRRYAHKS